MNGRRAQVAGHDREEKMLTGLSRKAVHAIVGST